MKRGLLPFVFLLIALPSLGYTQNLVVDYEQNHTVELYKEYNVFVQFYNNDTVPLEIGFGTPETWLTLNESSFVLNTTNATRVHNITVSILAEVDLGTFTRRIPYTVSWIGEMSEHELVFNIHAIEPQTSLQLEAIKKQFEIGMLKYDKGVLEIENVGEYPAWNITFSCKKWCEFDPDDQNRTFALNETDLIIFKIEVPLIQSNETNMTHSFEVCAKALNSKSYCDNLSVFVPFANRTVGECYVPEITPEEAAKVLEKFCEKFPFSPYCYFPEERNATVIRESCSLENLTQEDMNAYGVCRRDLNDTQQKFGLCQLTVANLSEELSTANTKLDTQTQMLHSIGGTGWVVAFLIGIGLLYAIFKYAVPYFATRLRGG